MARQGKETRNGRLAVSVRRAFEQLRKEQEPQSVTTAGPGSLQARYVSRSRSLQARYVRSRSLRALRARWPLRKKVHRGG